MADNDMPAARTIGIIAKPVAVKVAQTVGLTTAAFLAGQTAASSYVLLPSLMQSPAPSLAKQLRESEERERRLATPSAVTLSVLFGWLAYREPSISTRAFKFYALAAFLLPSAIPYTHLVLRPLTRTIADREASFNNFNVTTSTPSLPRQDTTGSSTVLVDHPPASSAGSDLTSDQASIGPGVDYHGTDLKEFVHVMGSSGPKNEEMTVHQLADKWGWLNMGRALLEIAGAMAGVWAVASEDLSFFELF